VYTELPLTSSAAEAEGHYVEEACTQGMGRHGIWEVDGEPVFELLYNIDGNLIGLELLSATDQPSPPWDISEHKGDDPYTFHIYFQDRLTACEEGSTVDDGSLGDRMVTTWGEFEAMPLTIEAAVEAGWINSGDCYEGEGIHAVWSGTTHHGGPWPLELTYDARGDLLGFEVVSMLEQPTGPWEHDDASASDPWTIHIWFRDPMTACEE
jgi:hypothetical protein